MFWDMFSDLCATVGKSPNAVAKEMKIPSGSITAWKNGTLPRNATISKIAEYFNVSVSYLLGEEKEKPTMTGEQISEAKKKVIDGLEDMTDEELLLLAARIKAIKDSRI